MGGTDNEINQTKNDQAIMTNQFKEKIKSKIDVAKFFAGVITLFIGLTIKEGDKITFLSKSSILLLIASLILCVLSIFAYDYLLWPKNYWHNYKEGPESEKEFQKKLVSRMLCQWKYLFVPSAISFILGLMFHLLELMGFKINVVFVDWFFLTLLFLILLLPVWLWKLIWADFGSTSWEIEEKNNKKLT